LALPAIIFVSELMREEKWNQGKIFVDESNSIPFAMSAPEGAAAK